MSILGEGSYGKVRAGPRSQITQITDRRSRTGQSGGSRGRRAPRARWPRWHKATTLPSSGRVVARDSASDLISAAAASEPSAARPLAQPSGLQGPLARHRGRDQGAPPVPKRPAPVLWDASGRVWAAFAGPGAPARGAGRPRPRPSAAPAARAAARHPWQVMILPRAARAPPTTSPPPPARPAARGRAGSLAA